MNTTPPNMTEADRAEKGSTSHGVGNDDAWKEFLAEDDTPESAAAYTREWLASRGLNLGDIPLFAGSAGEFGRHEIRAKVFLARIADRLNTARAQALREAVAKIEKSRTQKGIAARALDPGKAYAIAVLTDLADAFEAKGCRTCGGPTSTVGGATVCVSGSYMPHPPASPHPTPPAEQTDGRAMGQGTESDTGRLHTSACPMVLTPCTCADPEQPYVLIPKHLLAHLLDEADPATVQSIHDRIAGFLTGREGAGYTRGADS